MNTNRRRWMQLAALGAPGVLVSGCWQRSHDAIYGGTGSFRSAVTCQFELTITPQG